MGLLDWLKPVRTAASVEGDVVWLTKVAKLKGIAASAEARLEGEKDCAAVLLVGHFPNRVAECQELIAAYGFDRRRVLAVQASDLLAATSSIPGYDAQSYVDIIVVERHPLLSRDDALLEAAGRLPCRSRVAHHLSLEDPVMRAFAGGWLPGTLKTLGMSADESIQSPMVTRAIRKAQQRIADQAVGDTEAESAEAWLKMNCPEVGKTE
jgi:hypothetical protein